MKIKTKVVLISFAVSLLLGEAALRLLPDPAQSPKKPPQLRYFWSHNYLTTTGKGAVRARPRQSVREIATCGDRIEFDIKFKTNNLGFIDTVDYGEMPGYQRFFAIVGDSYTAGTGATPWITTLREDLQTAFPNIQVYNLGFVGTGVLQFAALLEETLKELPITDIIILVIADDFGRRSYGCLCGVLCHKTQGADRSARDPVYRPLGTVRLST
jgi:phage tail protein X